MHEVAIVASGLGKMFHIGGGGRSYKTLRESLGAAFMRPLRRLRRRPPGDHSGPLDYWALQDVSFTIRPGEIVGIIGRNGAGKSTLLKILAGITSPTRGQAEVRGRIGSLLEVGTGFHPELTGAENVYLNGAILGMPRATIKRKFDDIVGFAEVEKFIDTPVKHYSTGMYLRLAFSVAAHLDTEILLVDEVLAVGDMSFQEKCLGKMGDVNKNGRTVLFVSHSMASISNLCQKAIWLHEGRLKSQGDVQDVVRDYIGSMAKLSILDLGQRTDRGGDGRVRFSGVSLRDGNGDPTQSAYSGGTICVDLHYRSRSDAPIRTAAVSILVADRMGTPIFCCSSEASGSNLRGLPPHGTITCRIERLPLMPGEYSLMLILVAEGQAADKIRSGASLRVYEADFFASGKLPPPHCGNVLVPNHWSAGP